MDAEDDDLSALRSAALATLSKKAEKNDQPEEDLTALRQAALMTRKQKQIEVIQRPVQQKNAFPNWLDTRLPLPPPPVAINRIPPPQNTNVTIIRPINIPLPSSFHQRPSMPFSRPQTSWGANNLINLTPSPAPLLPTPRSNFRPGFVNVAMQIAPHRQAAPHRGPITQNVVVSTRATPLGPHARPQQVIRPLRQVTQPVKTHSVAPVNSAQNTLETKVPDKFSRYDPDSSSDDDDEDHATAAKGHKDEESDAESVVSDKSFSSVSEGAENEGETRFEDNNAGDEEEKQSGNGAPETKEEIPVANEEDGILAAIDEFLIEGIEPSPKEKEKTRKMAASEKTKSKPVVATKPKKGSLQSKGMKKSKVEFDRPEIVDLVQKGSKKAKRPEKKEAKPVTVTKTEGTKNTESSQPKAETGPSKLGGKGHNGKDSKGKGSVRTDSLPSHRGNLESVRTKAKSLKVDVVALSVPTSKKAERVRVLVQNPPQIQNQDHLTVQKCELPLVETRQRRDSDLDSVGSSDLSFLSSSESEAEFVIPQSNISKKPSSQSVELAAKRSSRNEKRDTNDSDKTWRPKNEKRVHLRAAVRVIPDVDERMPKRGIKERVGARHSREKETLSRTNKEQILVPSLREGSSEDSMMDVRKTQKSRTIDLRAKLKRDIGENVPEVEKARSLDLREKIKRRKNVTIEVEESAERRPNSKVGKASPLRTDIEHGETRERKSTIVTLKKDSRSRSILPQGRNIVITTKRTPSPPARRESTSPVTFQSNKQKPPKSEKINLSADSNNGGVKKVVEKGPSKKVVSAEKVTTSRKRRGSATTISHGNGDDNQRVRLSKTQNKRELDKEPLVPEKEASSESEREVEDVDILDLHEYGDMLFDLEGDLEVVMPQETTRKSRKQTTDTQPRELSSSSAYESESEGEIVERKQNVRRNTDMKKSSNTQRRSTETEEYEDCPSSKAMFEISTKSRRVLISAKPSQVRQKSIKSRDMKRKSAEVEESVPLKKSLKKRLGSRVVVSSDVSVEKNAQRQKKVDPDSDDGRRSTKSRKIVKTKRKKSSTKPDDYLEARIQRIKKQNGRILQRQMEIQQEKEKFG